MAYPNIIYGSFGDEKVAQSTKIGGLPLGAAMVLPDGRLFRHAKASATAMVAGSLYQKNTIASLAGSAAVTYLTGMAVATSAAVGALEVTVTCGGTAAMTKDLLEDGYLYTSSTIGTAKTYKIKSNAAAASGASMKITLYENDAIKEALAAGTTTVGIQINEYKSLTLTTADTTQTGPGAAGVAPVAVAASYYCWIQRRGPAAALVDNTWVLGEPVVSSTVAAGALGPYIIAASGTTKIRANVIIGYAMNVSASAEFGLANLALE